MHRLRSISALDASRGHANLETRSILWHLFHLSALLQIEIQAPGSLIDSSRVLQTTTKSSSSASRGVQDQVVCGICFISLRCCRRDPGPWCIDSSKFGSCDRAVICRSLRAWSDQVLCGVCFISPHCCGRDQGLWSNTSGPSRLTIEPVGLSAVFAVVSGPSLSAASVSPPRFVADEIKAVGRQLIASAMKTFIAIPLEASSLYGGIDQSLARGIDSSLEVIHLCGGIDSSLARDISRWRHSSISQYLAPRPSRVQIMLCHCSSRVSRTVHEVSPSRCSCDRAITDSFKD